MTATVLSRQEFAIRSEEDVLVVRRRVKTIAQERNFGVFTSAAVTTATSELTRNAWTHGGGGIAIIEELMDAGRIGIRVEFRDQGPGIDNIERVLKGGYSTGKSLGLGLSGSRRLVDSFTIESQVGRGTVVVITKWKPS